MTKNRRPSRPRFTFLASLGILFAWPAIGLAQDAASALLRLVPPQSPLILTVENLREHYPAFISSSLVEGLLRLPAVRQWIDSNHCKKLSSARDKIEAFLGTPIAEIRDAIFGDAVVLALQASPNVLDGRTEAVLLLRARNPELLRRLVRLIDEAQVAGGELARCVERRHGELAYVLREYPAGAKRAAEYHVGFPDGTFALSNSEGLIREVIDRRTAIDSKAGELKEISDTPKFQAVHSRLPEAGKAAIRLFVDPLLLERLSALISRPTDPAEARALELIGRYVAALDYAGAALTWQDGVLAIHTAEAIDAAKLDPAILRWARDPRAVDPELARLPATAFAMGATGIDLEAFYSLFIQLIADDQRPKLENLEVALTGILLGQDLHRRIFPSLGPSWIVYLDAPEESDRTPRVISEVPLVVAVSLGDHGPAKPPASPEKPASAGDPDGAPPAVTIAAAIDNALRTSLALASVDHKRNKGRNRVISRDVAGAQVTTLDTPIPFAYAVDRLHRRLVMGNSAGAVARYLEAGEAPEAGDRFRRIRAVADASSEARTFLALDLRALHNLAGRRRDDLAAILAERRNRTQAEPSRDLDQVIALIGLFDSAFATSRVEPDASSCVRRIGLIARPDAEQATRRVDQP